MIFNNTNILSGIYIHIPFCKQNCSYCNFYFQVDYNHKSNLVNAILREIDLKHSFLKTDSVGSIYFGGGTPSLLNSNEIEAIIVRLKKYYTFDENIEITLEANPDDITLDYLKELKKIEINRFSLGVQSFIDDELKILNRAHSSEKAINSIKQIQDTGFENFNIDLIFGIPNSNINAWEYNLKIFERLNIPHISCYGLTIEPKTIINYKIKKNKLKLPKEDTTAKMFEYTLQYLEEKNYIHYEISNYAKRDKLAIHNTNYWKGIPYLGLGPSAHSYDCERRRWNIASTKKYIESITNGVSTYEEEYLNTIDMYNEYILTGLRTIWGVDIQKINSFGETYKTKFLQQIEKHIHAKNIKTSNDNYTLTKSGKLIADSVIRDLFVV